MRTTILKFSIPIALALSAGLFVFYQQEAGARAETIVIAKGISRQLRHRSPPSYRVVIAAAEQLDFAGFTTYCEALNQGEEAERVRSRDALLDKARDVLTALHDTPNQGSTAQGLHGDEATQIRTVTLLTHLCMLDAERLCTASDAEQAIQPIIDALRLGQGLLYSQFSSTSWLGTSVIDQVCKRSLVLGDKTATPLIEVLSAAQRHALEREMRSMAQSFDISSLRPFGALQKIVKTFDQDSGDAIAALEFARLCQQFYAQGWKEAPPRTAVIHHFDSCDNRYAKELTQELRNAATPAWRSSFDQALAAVTSRSTETATPPTGR